VQKGKEDAAKLKQADTVNQKSALDLLTAQKKVKDSEWVSANAPTVLQKAKKMEMSDAEYTRMLQADPEFGKLLGTEQADAVKNYTAANLAYLNSAQDKVKALQEINQADDNYKVSMPENVRNDPNLALQHLKTRVLGTKAFEEKNAVKNKAGDVEIRDSFGNVIDIKPNPNKAKAVPELDSSGKEITRPTKLGNKTIYERKMSDGTWVKLAEDAPPAPKATGTGSKVYETLDANGHVQFELVKDNQLPTGKPKGDGVGKIEAGRIEMINNAANDAITSLSQIQSLPIAAQVLPLFNSADAKKGVFSENMKKFMANKVSEESAQIYRSIASGLALDAAKVKSGGMFVNQKVIDEITKGIIVQAGETEGTAMFKLAEAARRLYSSLATMTRGTPEQIEVRDALADYLKENFPDPNLILSAQTGIKYTPTPDVLHSIREKRKGGNGQASTPAQNTQTSQGKQPQTAYEWYVYRWNNAKNNPALQKKLTEEARRMGIAK
jgi:hypothetical protein